MTHEEYTALVERLETMAAAQPFAYKLRVTALAVLGYAYVFAIMLLLIVSTVAIVWGAIATHTGVLVVKLALPLFALLAAIGRALWVTVVPPQGRELHRSDAPTLFAEIDAVRRAVSAPAPHHVIVTDELNASVSQVPRLGIFGWQRNYLTIGLPLLTALTPDQFRAILAHEFGHLSRAHARFGVWIYRVRGTWTQIRGTIQERRSRLGALLVNSFVDWYEPYFLAYSFVLARRHEVEADRTSVTVVGGDVAAMALAAIELRSQYKNDVLWPLVTARIAHEPVPPRAAFAGMVQQIPAELPLPAVTEWLTAALRLESGVDDPHPALAHRLAGMGGLPSDDAALSAMAERIAKPIEPALTAAAHYLGPLAPTITAELDDRWCGKMTSTWKDRHRHLTRAREGLRELTTRGEAGPLSFDEQYRVADWTEDLQGADAALPLVTALVEKCPTHASGLFMLGRMLLARRDNAGVGYLERAMEVDPACSGNASSLIANHLRHVGRGREAIAYRMRADEAQAEKAAAQAERRSIAPHDTLASAALDEAAISQLREQLAQYPQVGRAWIGRKVTAYAPDRPFFIFGVERVESWWRYESEGARKYLATKLAEELSLPPGTLVIVLHHKLKWLKRALKKVGGAEVYWRDRGSCAISVNRGT